MKTIIKVGYQHRHGLQVKPWFPLSVTVMNPETLNCESVRILILVTMTAVSVIK